MEYFDVLNELGEKTGIIKERKEVHRDGDFHGSVHVWAYRISKKTREIEVLLQKRSLKKDTFPGCYDGSSTGHLESGEDYLDAAVREVKEELGIEITKDDLYYVGDQKLLNTNEFNGIKFNDREVNKIYIINRKIDFSNVNFDEEEVSGVLWHNLNEMIEVIKIGSSNYCTDIDEALNVWSKIIDIEK